MVPVEFYYAVGSRYSYLASTQIEALEADAHCRVEWLPIDSTALIARRSHNPFEGPAVSGQYEWSYREIDARRWAALYGVPFVEPRGRVQFDPQLLALAATAARRLGCTGPYSRQLFAAMFSDPVTRINAAECLRRAAACGIAPARFRSELENPATASEHAATLQRAAAAGVFGVPSFVARGELFWGNDRLPLLRHHLLGARA